MSSAAAIVHDNDSRAASNPRPCSQQMQWLSWLAELLPQAHALGLFETGSSSGVDCVASTDTVLPTDRRTALLAHRAATSGQRQRLSLTRTLVFALPVGAAQAGSGSVRVLVVQAEPLDDTQQARLIGLCQWALKSLHWMSTETPPESVDPPAMTPLAEPPRDLATLADRVSAENPGAQCAVHRVQWRRRGGLHSHVLAVSGQAHVDRKAPTIVRLNQLVEGLLAGHVRSESLPTRRCNAEQMSRLVPPDRAAGQPGWQQALILPFELEEEALLLTLWWCDDAAPVGSDVHERDDRQRQVALSPWVEMAWAGHERQLGLAAQSRRMLQRVWRRQAHRSVRRSVSLVALVLILALLLWPVDQRVAAEAIVEAAERHALIAPLDGHVRSVQARAGDVVERGDLLATLDAEELQQQAQKWTLESQKIAQDYQNALALHDRVQLRALREQQRLVQTELAQVRVRLARHELRAPISGIVLAEAVSEALGSAVESGTVLYEVGSAQQRRLVLQVPERRIGDIREGQSVSLRMSADPSRVSQATVQRLIPVATADQGESRFRVIATPLDDDALLRPGMQGIGRILVGQEPRLLQWWQGLWQRCLWLGWKIGLLP